MTRISSRKAVASPRHAVSLAVLIALILVAAAASRADAAVLYDQTGSPAPEFFTSNAYPANSGADSKLADDFTVPAGQTWQITQVAVSGIYPGSTPSTRVNIDIYADAGGFPGTVLLTGDVPGTYGPNYSIALAGTLLLDPGTYWIAVQQAEATSDAVWGWRGTNAPSGAEAAVLAQSCPPWPNWDRRSNCLGLAAADQVFRLSGCVGPCPPPPPPPPPAPPPPPPATLTRANALAAVRAALARSFQAWRTGHAKHVVCERRSNVRFRCNVSWLRRDDRFRGFVIAALVGDRVRTEVHVTRVERRVG